MDCDDDGSLQGCGHGALKLIDDEIPRDYWSRQPAVTGRHHNYEVHDPASYRQGLGGLSLMLWDDDSMNKLISRSIDKLSDSVSGTTLHRNSPSSWAHDIEQQFGNYSDKLMVEYLTLTVVYVIRPILHNIERTDKTLGVCQVSFHDRYIFNQPHVVVTSGNHQRPKFLLYTTKVDINISYDRLNEAILNPKTDDTIALRALIGIQELYSAMLLNRSRYGALTNCTHTIFVNAVFTSENEPKLFICRPILYNDCSRGFNTIGALTGIILTSLGYAPKLDTCSHAPTIRHEVLQQTMYGQQPIGFISLSSHLPKISSVGRTVRAVYQQGDKTYSNVYVRIANHTRNKHAAQLLQTEYNTYCRLTEHQGSMLPLVHAYGAILHTNRILVLENAGEPVDPLNVDDDAIKEMRLLIQELHNYQIVHNNISLKSFVRDEQENIKIIGFTHAIMNALPEQCDRDWCALRQIIRHVKQIRGNLDPRI